MAMICTNRSVTVNSTMNHGPQRNVSDSQTIVIYRNEAMSRVDLGGSMNALAAIVPIRAVDTLVANTDDILIAVVAKSIVSNSSGLCEKRLLMIAQVDTLVSADEGVARIVAMLAVAKTRNTQIKINAIHAHNALTVTKAYKCQPCLRHKAGKPTTNAAIANARVVGGPAIAFRDDGLAVNKNPSGQPMRTVATVNVPLGATNAQVVVATVTQLAVVMFGIDGAVA